MNSYSIGSSPAYSKPAYFVFHDGGNALRRQRLSDLERGVPRKGITEDATHDGFDEREDMEYNARNTRLKKAVPISDKILNAYRASKNHGG